MQQTDSIEDKSGRRRERAVDYCLQLLIIEHGDVHIKTLSQLLTLTSCVEEELSRYYKVHPA
ncbi:MAG: hypothetical protein WBN51_13430 [Gammaproteobacteria bacterium]|jgi:hypothetical protein